MMKNIKSTVALGTIAMFLLLALSPLGSASAVDKQLDTVQEQTIAEFVPSLMDAITDAQSYGQLVEIVRGFSTEWGRHPILVFLLELLVQGIGIGHNFQQLRPLRRDALVISWGFSHKLNPLRENKFQLYRPLTFWYYSGPAKLLLNSRTLIIDLYPFSVKSLTGRQCGLMRNFAGLYLHRQSTLWDKSWTIMMGRAMTVRGFDLSMLNVLNQ